MAIGSMETGLIKERCLLCLIKIKETGDSNPKSVKDKLDSNNTFPLKLTGIYGVGNTKQLKMLSFILGNIED